MNSTKKLWIYLGILLILSFSVLLWTGSEIYREAPPMPKQVVSQSGKVIYTLADIQKGRQVWQSFGGMQLGSIWGHGSYVAPDWSADWLHRESIALLNIWTKAKDSELQYSSLSEEEQAKLQGRLQNRMRQNTFDKTTDTITLDNDRADAIGQVASHYQHLFGNEVSTAGLREAYAMKNNTVPDSSHRHALTAFFWWTSWAAVTQRPNSAITYTNNWPAEPLVGNRPPASTFVWSAFSVIFLIAGIALLGWHHAVSQNRREEALVLPEKDPLRSLVITPSMRATAKYFWLLLALFLLQILLGSVTAHYQIEGQQQYGFNLSNVLPYALTRTWHTQLAVLWIATAWLATGLYIAPAISGHEPKYQRIGVNFLWISLIIIVVGSFTGQWFAVMQKMGLEYNFWFGHQGWEYSDMGRFWQWYLFVGLILWLILVGRALWPTLRSGGESQSIVVLLMLSTVAIGLFYGAALISNEHSHISTIEYWRWWLVHLWVEGFLKFLQQRC